MRRVVLVIDDDVTLRRSLCEALEEHDYVAIGACDGSDARDLIRLRGLRPDLILLDLGMPRLDGASFAASLRTSPELRAIPILVVSGRPDAPKIAGQLGARGCLAKPFPPQSLIEAVTSALAA